MTTEAPVSNRRKVIAWSLWDWGSAAFNAVIITFVFSVYLVNAVGEDLPGRFTASTLLAWGLGFSGFIVLITAPVFGRNADARGQRKRALIVSTLLVVTTMFALFFVKDSYQFFWLGVGLVGLGSLLFELAQIPYFSQLRQVSTDETVGRVSGIGWAAGYVGGIFLLLISYYGFIAGEGETRGFFNVSTVDGFNIRMVALLSAVWFLVFALPLFFAVPEIEPDPEHSKDKEGLKAAYAGVIADIKDIWQHDRKTVSFLFASAIFRDGLSGVFTFGAILAVSVYGIDEGQVLIFGVAANIIAAAGAYFAGFADDWLGPKVVIVVSLASMIAVGTVLLFVEGPKMFWIFGLMLTAFVGPAQSASRSFLTRMTAYGREGINFGMYAMTGRAVSFLAPTLFGVFVAVTGDDRYGILGILIVLSLGLLLLLTIPGPNGKRATEKTLS